MKNCFSLLYPFSYIQIFEIKKKNIMILVHRNADKMAKCLTRQTFSSDFINANLDVDVHKQKNESLQHIFFSSVFLFFNVNPKLHKPI